MKTALSLLGAAALSLVMVSPALAQASEEAAPEELPGWVYIASAVAIAIGGVVIIVQLGRSRAAKNRE